MTHTLLQRAMNRAAPAGVSETDAISGVLSAWETMFAALSPVIGDGGVAALFMRTCEVTRRDHAWICRLPTGGLPADAIAALRVSLEGHGVDEICRASHAMLTTFVGLLSSLIGSALTQRLLCTAWPEIALDVCEGDTAT